MSRFDIHIRWMGILCACLVITSWTPRSFGEKKPANSGIPPEQVALYAHSIIEADRTVYTTHVVNRMQDKGIVAAAEHWEQQNALPLPAQFLQRAGRLVAEKGSGIRYRLISLWPIYRRNGPATDFERKGLETVTMNPDTPYMGTVISGKKQYFQAIFADKAVTKACIDCHNLHPLSPKRNFKLNSVLGGIVITIPIDQ
ncbi:Tll0287-like domain-containing protein [Nitrospira sp. M1]